MAGRFDGAVLRACQWNQLCVQMSKALITQGSLLPLKSSFKFDTKTTAEHEGFQIFCLPRFQGSIVRRLVYS